MGEAEGTIVMIESDDGVLLLGPEDLLSAFDAQYQEKSRPLTSQTLARTGNVLGAGAQLQATSGRWLKLTAESTQYLKSNGVAQIRSGVVRGKDLAHVARGGQIAKHLKFESLALATPAAPAALAAIATQAALEAALNEITEYLKVIDAKLDQLLKQRKIETLGQMGGVTLAIEEANSIYTHTGKVSSVTWSKVQANSLALQTMQAEAVAQLHSLADEVKQRVGNTDQSAKALDHAQKDAPFWLGVLARTMALQDRQYVLELARVADAEPSQLEDHRQGIQVARADRARRISRSLDTINASVRQSADLTNLDRVANPFNAPEVTIRANHVTRSISEFAEHADLELIQADQLDRTLWGSAARALLGDAGSRVNAKSTEAASRAKALGTHFQERRENALLARAQKIKDKRRAAEEVTTDRESEPDMPSDE